ncbi:MAG: chromosomal replication initiator protein DnaA [Ruminococcaceae bacterium]|nr:chromosomal replication initiator protein DnaA [Oscillospiraceae bacterium]
MDNFNELWQSVLAYCKERITATAFDLWLSKIEIKSFDNGKATLFFSNEFKKSTVIGQYGNLISEAFEKVCGFPVEIIYTSPEDFITEDVKTNQGLEDLKNDILTFDNFIVGPSNKFAYTAAKAIASDPGGQISRGNNLTNYNPLFIYGNSGLGKTHILNAISYEIKKNFPDMKVVYIKAEEFANEFISCLGKHTVDEFHNKYRNNIDVFLVDDIQFIAGKISTEEEFFHTFNALVDNGKQVVLTSDRPPKEIHTLADRLRSRFVSGLLADIQTPEYETRCAIIKRKAELLNFEIPDNVVNYIAERIKSNIRQLEGTTKKLHATCVLTNQVPTISLAQTAIKDIIEDVQPIPITINRIVEEVSRTTGVSVEDIYSKKRTASISNAKKMCFYIIREITGMSYADIGKEFNNMDHSSVLYNIQKMETLLKTDSNLNSKVLDIINNIKDSN